MTDKDREQSPAGSGGIAFWRRAMIMMYDGIAVVTVIYFASFVPVIAAGGALAPGNPLLSLYMLIVMFGYFALGWTRGRTLGMQAWKVEIVTSSGERPGLRQALIRFFAAAVSFALCGIGYWAALFDAERCAWPERWSGTRLQRTVSGRAR